MSRRSKWTVVVNLPVGEDLANPGDFTVVHGFSSYQQAKAALAVAQIALRSGELTSYELLDEQGFCLVDSMWDSHQQGTREVLPPGRYAWDEASESLRPASLQSKAAHRTTRQLVTGGGGAAEGAPVSV